MFDPSSYSFDSVAINGLAVWIIQRLKMSNGVFAFIREGRVVQIIGALVAALTAAGMAVDWTVAGGSGTLTITGITVGGVISFLWLTVKNVVFQHLIYHGTYGRKTNGLVGVAGLQASLPPPQPIKPA